MRSASLLVVAIAVAFLAADAARGDSAQLDVAKTAQSMIADKIEASRPTAVRRARALYRVSRSAGRASVLAPNSTDGAALISNLRWMLARDLELLNALEGERQNVASEILELAIAPEPPAQADERLLRPVVGASLLVPFGPRHRGKLELASRGVTWTVPLGSDVRAPVSGAVVYTGTVGGEGLVILESASEWIVLRSIEDAPARGSQLARGERIGRCSAATLTLERRTISSRGGVPVDPGPFDPR